MNWLDRLADWHGWKWIDRHPYTAGFIAIICLLLGLS